LNLPEKPRKTQKSDHIWNEILGNCFFWTLLLYVERQWNDCLSGIKFSKLVFIFQARILVEYFTDYLGYFIVWTFL